MQQFILFIACNVSHSAEMCGTDVMWYFTYMLVFTVLFCNMLFATHAVEPASASLQAPFDAQAMRAICSGAWKLTNLFYSACSFNVHYTSCGYGRITLVT